MIRAIADTHAVVWYLIGDKRLSAAARQVFSEAETEGHQIGLSSISVAEIVYLVEKRRLADSVLETLLEVLEQDGVLTCLPFDLATAQAMRKVQRRIVPDMPDRMIGATASQLSVPVISRDAQIQASSVDSIW